MTSLEIEKTYLAKYIPEGLINSDSKEILDIYIPYFSEHPTLRIRKSGDTYEITKKTPVKAGDGSQHIEYTTPLTKEEFDELSLLKSKKVHKTRYYYPYKNRTAEIDVFLDDLSGLVLVDFEFKSEEEFNEFILPEFCLADVTQEVFLAGGILCGKSYKDIEDNLNRFEYKPLFQ